MTDKEVIPQFRWRLSAPESLILLWGPETGDAWACKIALQELLVRRVFSVSLAEEKRFLRAPITVTMLTQAATLDPNAGAPLQTIVNLHRELAKPSPAGAVPVERLARALFTYRFKRVRRGIFRRGWDRSGGGYVAGEILPGLQTLGLMKPVHTLRLAIIPSTTWWLTPEGNQAFAELTRFIDTGRTSLQAWATHEPDLARQFISQVGPTVLLTGGIADTLSALRRESGAGFNERVRDPYMLESYLGQFGPDPVHDLDFTFHLLSLDVDRAWEQLQGGGAGGGGLIFLGE